MISETAHKQEPVPLTSGAYSTKLQKPNAVSELANADDSDRWLLRYPRAVPIFTFLLIAAVTIMSVTLIERGVADNERIRLVRAANALSSTLERRGTVSASYLRAGAALFATTGDVSMSDFSRFVSELQLDQDARSIEGIGWAPALTPDQVPTFEQDTSRALGMPISVFPTSRNDLIVPVRYLEPDTTSNRSALGFDMYSEAVRRAAMKDAAEGSHPVASGRVNLIQQRDGTSAGFLIYMPVHQGQGINRRLIGYIYSPINAQQFLNASQTEELREEGIATRFYDGPQNSENLLGGTAEMEDGSRAIEVPIEIADREMTLVVALPPSSTLSPLSLVTLLFGLAVASLLMLVARLLTRRAIEDQQRLNWFEEQNSIRNSLTRELNHRVKNTLANVLSIIALTRRRAGDVNDFADGLAGRVRALSATHDLLTNSEWGTTPVDAVIDAELAPYASGMGDMVTKSGPDVELAPNDALSLGMAIHELATNAAKYGALSVPDGRVSIDWTLTEEGLAEIHWKETGGPPVQEKHIRGFGMDLIQKVVAHELRHPVDLQFHREGVQCTLLAPVRQPTTFSMRAKQRSDRRNIQNVAAAVGKEGS